jgi:hypothetical protein
VSDIPDAPTALGTRYQVRLTFFGRVNFLIDEFEPVRGLRFNCDPPASNSLTGSSSTPFRAAPGSNHLVELKPHELKPHGLAVLAERITASSRRG